MNFRILYQLGAVLSTAILDTSYCSEEFVKKASVIPLKRSLIKSKWRTGTVGLRDFMPLWSTFAKEIHATGLQSPELLETESQKTLTDEDGQVQEQRHRTRRSRERDLLREDRLTLDSENNRRTAPGRPSLEDGHGFNIRPQRRKRVRSYKDPNRPRKVTSRGRSQSRKKSRNSKKFQRAKALSIPKLHESVTSRKKPLPGHQTTHKTVVDRVRHIHSELNKRQNRPPWLSQSQRSTTTGNVSNSENEMKTTPDYTFSPATGSSTESTEDLADLLQESQPNHTQVTSLPDLANIPVTPNQRPSSDGTADTSSAPMNSNNAKTFPISTLTAQTASSTTQLPRQEKHQLPGINQRKCGKAKPIEKTPDRSNPQMATDGIREDGAPMETFKSSNTDCQENDSDKGAVADETTSAEGMGKKTTESATPGSTDCPTCGKHGLMEDEVKKLRIQMFKNLMIEKLRLDPNNPAFEVQESGDNVENRRHNLGSGRPGAAPKLPYPLLEPTLRDNREQEERDDFYAKDLQVIIAGRDMGHDCINMRATGCFSFPLQGQIDGEISDAQLWLYKMRDKNDLAGQTFVVYELQRSKKIQLQRRNLIARKDTFTKEDWISMNVTRAVKRWVDKRRESELLALRCKSCFTRNYKALYGVKEDYKPLLVINYANSPNMRRKRSEPCDPRYSCCKRPLEVTFSNIGINYIQPQTLSIGYCYGSCEGQLLYNDCSDCVYNHTVIVQKIRRVSTSLNEELKPCCVPVSPLDVIVMTSDRNDNNRIVTRLLTDIVVSRCGCA